MSIYDSIIIHSSLTKYFSDNNYIKEGPKRLKLCFYLPYIGDASFNVQGSINLRRTKAFYAH